MSTVGKHREGTESTEGGAREKTHREATESTEGEGEMGRRCEPGSRSPVG
jgi:hypothetical protein